MKSKSFMLMVLSMGFGLIAAIGISQVMGRSNGDGVEAQKMGPVIVSADHIDMNSLLTEDNVSIENWPLDIIPEDAATSLEDIKDMYIKTRMSKGMPLIKSAVVTRQNLNKLPIPDGSIVVAIKVSGDSLLAGLLGPGDKVNVIGFFKRRTRGGGTQTTTRTFLKALRVFSVNNRLTAADKREEGGASSSGIVGVLVTQKQSEELIHVMKTGSIQLVMRSTDELDGDDDVDSLDDILDWGKSNDVVNQDDTGNPNNQPIPDRSMFSPPSYSMIVWNGNSPEKVVFSANSLPQKLGPSAVEPSRSQVSDSMDEQVDEVDFNGSNEIDRNLEQDQYRGE